MAEIICPECAATYQVPDQALGAGRKVRCAACKTLWLARAPLSEPVAGTDDAGPGAAVATDAPEPPAEMVVEPPASSTPPAPASRSRDVRPRDARQRPWHQRIGSVPSPRVSRGPMLAALALGLLIVAAVGLRASIVRHVPEAGRVYAALGLPVNLTGLELSGIKSGLITEDGVELLVVQGEIANVSATARSVPRLRFSVLDAKGVPLYAWTAQSDAKQLQPGERQTFRRRLASPPPEGREVLVRFAGKADLVALSQ